MVRPGALLASVSLGCLLLADAGGTASAQTAPYFSPTYAASEGSPYSEVYARTFGAGGSPLETSAPPPALTAPPPPLENAPPTAVYVIEDGRVLTYSAEDYTQGGEALARSDLPSVGGGALHPEVRVPTVTDQFYAAPALETGTGPDRQGQPIPLMPQRKPAN